jgi:hypothetical protein
LYSQLDKCQWYPNARRLAVIAIHRRVVAWFADIEPDTDVFSLLPEFK